MVLQTSSRTTRQHRKKSSPEKSSVGTDYSRAEGNSRFRALSSKSLDFRAILSGTLGTQFATPCDCRSVRVGIGCVKRNFREICSFGTNADIIFVSQPMSNNQITFNTNLSETPRTRADFTYKITPTLISITDTGLGQRPVTEDIEAVLRKIEYWHQVSISSF